MTLRDGPDRDRRVDVSIGIASCRSTPKAMVCCAADAALYQAKELGRSSCQLWPPEDQLTGTIAQRY